MQRIRKKKLQPKFTQSFELQKNKQNTPYFQHITPKPMIVNIPSQAIGRINIDYSAQNNDMLVSQMLQRCGQRRLGFGSLAESIGKEEYQVREMAEQILEKGLNYWIQIMNSVQYRGLFGQKYQWELGDIGSVVNKMLTNRKNKHKKQVYIKLRQNCVMAERYLRVINSVHKFSTEKINQVLDLMTQVWRWEYRDQLEDYNDNTNLTSGEESDYIYKQQFNPIIDDQLKAYHPQQKQTTKKQSVIHFDIEKKQFYQQQMDDIQQRQRDKESSLSVQELSEDSNHFRVNLPESVAEKMPNKIKQQYQKLQNYDKGPIFKDQLVHKQKYNQSITSEFFTQEQHVHLCQLYCLFGNNFELVSKRMLIFIKRKLKNQPLTKQDWQNITKKVQPQSIKSQLLYLFQSGIQIMKAYVQGYDQFKQTLQSTFGLTQLMFYLDAVVNSQFLLEKIMSLQTEADFDNTDKVHFLMTEQLNRDFSTAQQMRDLHVATANFDNIMGIIQLNFDRIIGQNYLLDMLNYVIDNVKDQFHEPIDDDQQSAKSISVQPKFQTKFETKFEPGQNRIKLAKQQFINIKKQVKCQGAIVTGPIPWRSQDDVIVLDD